MSIFGRAAIPVKDESYCTSFNWHLTDAIGVMAARFQVLDRQNPVQWLRYQGVVVSSVFKKFCKAVATFNWPKIEEG
jgi:hypothetical protein